MTSVVYMVAGMSSRFGGRVKQFAQVGINGETLIEVSMKQAIKTGFDKIIFIVGEKTETLFKEKFGNKYCEIPIFYAKQDFDANERDKPWGTCDAVVSAKEVICENFVVCNGDDIYGENSFKILHDWLSKNNSCATLGFELGKVVPEKGSVNRAVYETDKENNVLGLNEVIGIEKSKMGEMNLSENTLCSMNIFALTKSTLPLLEKKLQEFKSTHKGDRKSECYLPTELSNLIKQKKISLKLLPTPDSWIGITNPEDEEVVRKKLAE